MFENVVKCILYEFKIHTFSCIVLMWQCIYGLDMYCMSVLYSDTFVLLHPFTVWNEQRGQLFMWCMLLYRTDWFHLIVILLLQRRLSLILFLVLLLQRQPGFTCDTAVPTNNLVFSRDTAAPMDKTARFYLCRCIVVTMRVCQNLKQIITICSNVFLLVVFQ